MHVYPAALANEESLSNRTDHQAFVKDKPTLQALADSVPDNENMSGEPTLQAPATNTSVDPTVLVPGLNRPHSLTEDARELSATDLTRAPALRVTESDSEACDGDESSEGEDDSPRPDNSWSSLAVEIPQLSPQLTSQEAVDDSSKRLVTDQKHSPAKRRRKRRPKAFTGSPKLSASGSPPAPSTPSVANQNSDDELPGQYSANHESDGGSHDQQSANQESDDNDYSDVVSSDNDDLLNSTGLSEGSNWDYYQAPTVPISTLFQDPPYSTGTEPDLDIDLEPKLDDSVLQWDDELDDNNATLTLDVQPREPRLMAHAAAANDSEDSDIEDLHYVIQQSSTQLLQADSALRKPRKDVVQCGVYLDPQKYLEWHATCQTNIKCLQVIQEHLESEQGLANLTDDDIQQVLDLISKWQSLEKLALQRKEQSASLCKMYRDIMAGKNQVKLADEQTSVAAFNDVGELEGHFRSLQTFRVNLQSQTHKLQQISDSMLVFESENKKIKMAGFKKLLSELSSEIKPAILNVGKRTTDLQYAVVQWHKWNTDCKELETHLVKTSFDIETVELGLCEQKLVELEASFSDFSSVCTAAAQFHGREVGKSSTETQSSYGG
ncbi:hypothetical protein EB796_013003 [Bugula neritina]|uniref:Uncharacterized protein n=1 Tax=Bugula neritina TaxID=10212 RepID=A0A7J7JQP1_BUGNE|nr:hypothetical protein EB796_013003 [Bugula neritina]